MALSDQQRDQLTSGAALEAGFINYISHELRGQLNHIVLLLEMIAADVKSRLGAETEQLADLDEARRIVIGTVEGMDLILRGARRRAEGMGAGQGDGGVEQQFGPVDMEDLLGQMIRLFAPDAARKNLRLLLDPVPLEARRWRGDRRVLALVLHNLLRNAIKYSDKGTIHLSAEADAGSGIALSVSDEGPGIAPGQQQRIFEEFVRTPEARTDEDALSVARGTGLGLAIAARAARQIGGELTVQSTPGAGSTFQLRCPAAG